MVAETVSAGVLIDLPTSGKQLVDEVIVNKAGHIPGLIAWMLTNEARLQQAKQDLADAMQAVEAFSGEDAAERARLEMARDERVRSLLITDELSIGDYVLSGGELAAMVVIDAVTRQLPGVLGHELSAQEDSFADGLLDCPHYTRPEEFAGRRVPEVLLGGNHEEIRRWRLKQALGRTHERRPDLLEGRPMTAEEQALLAEYLRERE